MGLQFVWILLDLRPGGRYDFCGESGWVGEERWVEFYLLLPGVFGLRRDRLRMLIPQCGL